MSTLAAVVASVATVAALTAWVLTRRLRSIEEHPRNLAEWPTILREPFGVVADEPYVRRRLVPGAHRPIPSGYVRVAR